MSAQNPANPSKKKNEKYIALFVLLFFIALIVLAGVSIIKKRLKNKPKEGEKKEVVMNSLILNPSPKEKDFTSC